eukprot:8732685-Alexandrium_andersonii.AAC.1
MSSALTSGSSCSPISDICSLVPTVRASAPADRTPAHAGPGRLSGSSGASRTGRELLEEADA